MSTIQSSHFGSSFGRSLISMPEIEWRESAARKRSQKAISLWRATIEAGKETSRLPDVAVNTIIAGSAAAGLIIAAWKTLYFVF